MPTKIQLRRGTAAQWTTTNPLLAEGEQGLETDTGKTKIGNGATPWTELPYAGASIGGTDTQVQFNDGGVFAGASGWTWNKATNTMTLASGTQTADNPAQTITQTWNNAGATFTGLRLNVTDTASNAGSLLADFQVGGVSRFNVSKNGNLRVPNGSFIRAEGAQPNSGIRIGGNGFNEPALAVQWVNAASIALSTGRYSAGFSWLGLNSSSIFGWGSDTDLGVEGAALDTVLARDAANTLAQRNGTNAQTFRLYNSYTDASNYERGFMRWSSNVLEIGNEKAGTGVSRSIKIIASGPNCWFGSGGDVQWTINSSGNFTPTSNNANDIGGPSERVRHLYLSQMIETFEMTAPAAPATNGVRIYAEDNGAGKTRLMARFATGAAVQIAIEP